MPNRLIPEEIEEVSLVDVPANNRKLIVVKRRKSFLKDALERLEEAMKIASEPSLERVHAAIKQVSDAEEDEGQTLKTLDEAVKSLEEAVAEAGEKTADLLKEALDAVKAHLAMHQQTETQKAADDEEVSKMNDQEKAGMGAYYGPPGQYGYPQPYGYPGKFKEAVTNAVKQIRDALKDQKLPDKVKGALDEALASLEALVSAYGYGYAAKEEKEGTEKRGRRFSKENESRIREIYRLAKELVDQVEALGEEPEEQAATPWEQERESEYLAKCVDLINEIVSKVGVQ